MSALRLSFTLTLLLALFGPGCVLDEAPTGLRRTPPGAGPSVVFELGTRPLPDVPFPNDLLARATGGSRTGLSLNLSVQGSTALERRLRTEGLALDGFSGLAPITVRFDAPLDLGRLDGRGRPFAADPVLVLCISAGCRGERVDLDLGRGRYPTAVVDPSGFFEGDPRAGEPEVLFETVAEDLDGDGRLDRTEDSDGDGVLDRPNVGPDGAPLSWYEVETDTLLLRPLRPLQAGESYAVVLTEDVQGRDGAPIRSPFEWVHHLEQARQLADLEALLARHGRSVDEVAFAWTFTVQTAADTLEQLAAGLLGEGPFAQLAADFPPDVIRLDRLQTAPDGLGLLSRDQLAERVRALAAEALPDSDPEGLVASLSGVGHLVAGRFVAPNFLADDDGLAAEDRRYPADGDEVFRLAPTPVIGRAEVPFWCVVPAATAERQPPFPVALLGLDRGESRLHGLRWAGVFARHGLATCTLEGFGQGSVLSAATVAALDALEPGPGGSPLALSLQTGRARDLNNDGAVDPDGDFLSGELAHGRDVIRQSVVDWLQFIRVLRSFDGERRWAVSRAEGERAGDFDGDGVPDLGGPTVALHATGQGFGGNLAVILAGLSPELQRIAPVSAGGGLADVLVRSGDPGLRGPFWRVALGPLVVGRSGQGGATELAFVGPGPSRVFALDEQLVVGDRIRLRNLANGEQRETVAHGGGGMRLAVPADGPDPDDLRALLRSLGAGADPPPVDRLGDRLRLEIDEVGGRRRVVDSLDLSVEHLGARLQPGAPLVALESGFALQRQTPRLRRFMEVVQTVLDPADPVHYAGRIFAGPGRGRAALVLLTAGDPVIPVSAGLTLARALGLEMAVEEDRLVAAGAVTGLAREGPLVDVGGWGAPGAAERLEPPVRPSMEGGQGAVHLRIAWLDPAGAHGFGSPTVADEGGPAGRLADALARFLATGEVP